ncbi:MAG: serpin family protein [Eubacteriales bacterium]
MKNSLIKKIIMLSIILLLPAFCFLGCSVDDPNATPTAEVITPEPIQFVENVKIDTYNDFAIELLKQVRREKAGIDEIIVDNTASASASSDGATPAETAPAASSNESTPAKTAGNVIISPINVGVALTMFYIGASGDTQTGIENALNLDLGDTTQLTLSSKDLMDQLSEQQGAEFANGYSLYVNEGPTIREDFAVRMEDYFRLNLNFTQFDEERLEDHLNDWASEITSTSASIQNLFPENYIPHNIPTFMLSVSSVDCKWDTAFNLANTRTLPFTADNGKALAVPTLRGKMTIKFYEDDDVTVGFLPLYGGKTTLAIFIPPDDDPIDKFLSDFTGDNIVLWKALAYEKEKWLYIPKVSFSSPNVIELSNVLSKMGASEMFNSEIADFTNLGNNFYVDRFYQVSQIRITETGENKSDIEPVDITRANNNGEDFFIVGRSFIFAILDEETGGILSIGTLENPVEP